MIHDQDIYEQTLKDKLTLGPVAKYQKYGRFPWKLILNILLIGGTTYQVTLITSNEGVNQRNLDYFFSSQILGFTDMDYVYTVDDSPQINFNTFLSLIDFQGNMLKVFEVMGNIASLSYADFNQTKINQTVNYIQVYPRCPISHNDTFTYNFTLQDGFTIPFDVNDVQSIKGFLGNVSILTFQFNDLDITTIDPDLNKQVEKWNLKVKYSLEKLQYVYTTIDIYPSEEETTFEQSGVYYKSIYNSHFWFLDLIVILLALASLVLNIKYIFDMVTLFTQAKFKSVRYAPQFQSSQQSKEQQQGKHILQPQQEWIDQFDIRGHKQISEIIKQQKPWNMLNMQEKLLFVDIWVLLNILGNSLQIFTSLLLIFNHINLSYDSMQVLLGFACLISWLSFCKYIEYQDNVYILTFLLKYSLPTILRFMLGVLPFFIGYAILGQTLFYKSSYFSSFTSAFVSLICLSYGNELYEVAFYTGQDITCKVQFHFLNSSATLFVVTFSIIFLLVFQNILMTIFVSIVYNKFNAQIQQEMLDYLHEKIPNLNELLAASNVQKSRYTQLGSQRFNTPKMSNNVSPALSAMNDQQQAKNTLLYDIRRLSKQIEKTANRMIDDFNDDLKLFVITKKTQKMLLQNRKGQCLDYLLQKSTQISRKVAAKRKAAKNDSIDK